MKSAIEIICLFILGILLIIVSGMLWGLIIKVLWNWLMTDIFGLCTITWLQGWGISVLASSIFGGLKTTINEKK